MIHYLKKNTIFQQDRVGNPKLERQPHLACSGGQSQRRIRFYLAWSFNSLKMIWSSQMSLVTGILFIPHYLETIRTSDQQSNILTLSMSNSLMSTSICSSSAKRRVENLAAQVFKDSGCKPIAEITVSNKATLQRSWHTSLSLGELKTSCGNTLVQGLSLRTLVILKLHNSIETGEMFCTSLYVHIHTMQYVWKYYLFFNKLTLIYSVLDNVVLRLPKCWDIA